MSKEYKKLQDLCISVTDCPHSTPQWTKDGFLVIRNYNIKNGRLDLSKPSYTNKVDFAKRIQRAVPEAGDIIITREAPMGEVCRIPNGLECCLGQRMVLLKPNYSLVDGDYLLYALMSKEVQTQILYNEGTGSTVSNLRIPLLCNLPIPYVDRTQQRKISGILANIDHKIALNTAINDNLQQQVKTLFAEMFPFAGSIEMANGVLSDIAHITMGQSPNGKSYNEAGIGTVFFQGRAEFGFRFPVIRLFTTEPKRMATRGDTLMSVRAPVGDLNVAHEHCCIGRGLSAIHSKYGHSSFILYTMFSLRTQLDIFNGQGTVFGSINKDALNEMPVFIPETSEIERFENIAAPIDRMILKNHDEIVCLTALRDVLLPRLMSGELDVSGLDLKSHK